MSEGLYIRHTESTGDKSGKSDPVFTSDTLGDVYQSAEGEEYEKDDSGSLGRDVFVARGFRGCLTR